MTTPKMDAAQRRAALELEFERLKERADWLDRVLQGDPDAWAPISEALSGRVHIGVIEMDKPIAEARQVSLAMATVWKALTAMEAKDKPVVEVPADPLAAMEKARDNVIPLRSTGTE